MFHGSNCVSHPADPVLRWVGGWFGLHALRILFMEKSGLSDILFDMGGKSSSLLSFCLTSFQNIRADDM